MTKEKVMLGPNDSMTITCTVANLTFPVCGITIEKITRKEVAVEIDYSVLEQYVLNKVFGETK